MQSVAVSSSTRENSVSSIAELRESLRPPRMELIDVINRKEKSR